MKSSERSLKNKIFRWTRIIHRDLGYLMVGVCLIYALSGILLNHMDGKDPAFSTEEASIRLSPGLNREELKADWDKQKSLPQLRKIISIDDEHLRLMLNSGIGIYNRTTGTVDYETHSKRPFVYWINKLHYNKVKGWSPVADFFAVSLIFFAVSGLIMVKGKKGIAGRGKWYLAAGILLPIIYILLG